MRKLFNLPDQNTHHLTFTANLLKALVIHLYLFGMYLIAVEILLKQEDVCSFPTCKSNVWEQNREQVCADVQSLWAMTIHWIQITVSLVTADMCPLMSSAFINSMLRLTWAVILWLSRKLQRSLITWRRFVSWMTSHIQDLWHVWFCSASVRLQRDVGQADVLAQRWRRRGGHHPLFQISLLPLHWHSCT